MTVDKVNERATNNAARSIERADTDDALSRRQDDDLAPTTNESNLIEKKVPQNQSAPEYKSNNINDNADLSRSIELPERKNSNDNDRACIELVQQEQTNNKQPQKATVSNDRKETKKVKKPRASEANKKFGKRFENMDTLEARRELLEADESHCGSSTQASTSFVSSSVFGGSQEWSLERPASNEANEFSCVESIGTSDNKLASSNKGGPISRSMLDLDKSMPSQQDGFSVVWHKLSFAYEKSLFGRRRAPVLCNISGHFNSNELVAVIGPSGCGKTTLLHFLAGNQACQRDKLRIVGLDEPKAAFIGQDDNLLPGLSARETLMYASRLQNGRAGFDHARHIQPIITELGLSECAERSVTKLSGGQAKRVAIAQELLYPTNLLILDEVTSGLDASTSYSIVKLLKHLVSDRSYPMSIVMSIHQPSARLFAVFDRVYVMSEGQCIYEGSCQVDHVNAYLGQFGLKCPRFHNIADYLIEIACCLAHEDGALKTGESIRAAKEQMIELQRKCNEDLFALVRRRFKTEHCAPVPNECVKEQSVALLMPDRIHEFNGLKQQQQQQQTTNEDNNYSLYEAIERARSKRERPFCDQFLVHFFRSILRIRRSVILTYLQLLTYITLGVQLATFYGPEIGQLSGCPRPPTNLLNYMLQSSHSTSNDDQDQMSNEMRRIQENMNFLLVTVLTATFAALEITVITFPMEAKTIKREWRNGWYRVTSYFLGRTLADLPFSLVFLLVFCALVFTLTGQIGLYTWRFVAFVGAVVMTALVAQSFGFIFGATFMDNLPAAVFMAPLAIFPSLLFSGFFSRVSQIPWFYKPMTYISHFRYTFDALLVSLYGHGRCECNQAALSQYHASLANQSETIRDTFAYMFGTNECDQSTESDITTTMSPNEMDENLIAHDDLATIGAHNSSLAALLNSTLAAFTSSNVPLDSGATSRLPPQALQDALVDTLLAQINTTTMLNSSSSTTSTMAPVAGPEIIDNFTEMSAMDRLSYRFSQSITNMLSKQANFGHKMPRECSHYSSYLLQEFELQDDDLINGMLMLLLFVLATRLLCGLILNFMIATRAR